MVGFSSSPPLIEFSLWTQAARAGDPNSGLQLLSECAIHEPRADCSFELYRYEQ